MDLLTVVFALILSIPSNVKSPDTLYSDTTSSVINNPDSVLIVRDSSQTDNNIPKSDTITLKDTLIAGDTVLIKDTIIIDTIKKDTISIIGVGDIMFGTNYPSEYYLPPGKDCEPLMRDVRNELQSADITFGNMEAVFSSKGGTAKPCRDTTQCYVFRMPDQFIECFINAGFDVVSIANNHTGDFGPQGRKNTVEVLENSGIYFAGDIEHPYTIFTREGITYGFCAFAPNSGTMSLYDLGAATGIVSQLDSMCDIVMVSFHGGAEGKEHQHVTRETESFLGHNRGNVYRFAHAVIDAGADVIFGHGPHVTRAVEVYNNRFICYSLGNFCTYARFNISGPNGIAPLIKVFVTSDGRFLYGKITPVCQVGRGITIKDTRKRAIYKLKDLTRQDFPESIITITENGNIVYSTDINIPSQ